MIFGQRQQEIRIMGTAVAEEEKWLKFHDGEYQFKVPFILYLDFESILKLVDERCKFSLYDEYNEG